MPVVGNVCESNLGLEESFNDAITDEIDIIVNSAANTTFDERLMLLLNSFCIASLHCGINL